jgi:Holliday junction resolvase RusA-like endonuclease
MNEEILFQVVIPGRARILKNSKKLVRPRGSRRMIPVSSDRYKRWELFAQMFIARAFRGKSIDFPVNVEMKFFFKDHQHEPDLSNLYQGVEDILQKCGVLVNDKFIYSHDGSAKVFGDGAERVEVTVKKFVK